MMLAPLLLIKADTSIRADAAAIILFAAKTVWPKVLPKGQIDVVNADYTFNLRGPFNQNPFVDGRKPKSKSDWQSSWGFNHALQLWKVNIHQERDWAERRKILDDVISKTKGLNGSWGEVPPPKSLDFGPTFVVRDTAEIELVDEHGFMKEYRTKGQDGKKRNIHLLIHPWKPCFSADGKYAFVALPATWSLIHEAELAFLFERTATGWKMILRQDTVRL